MSCILSDYIRITQEIYIKINHRNKMERRLLEAKDLAMKGRKGKMSGKCEKENLPK